MDRSFHTRGNSRLKVGNDDRLELFSRSADVVTQLWSFEGNTGVTWKQGQATVQASSTWQLVIQGIKKFQVANPNLIGKDQKSKNNYYKSSKKPKILNYV